MLKRGLFLVAISLACFLIFSLPSQVQAADSYLETTIPLAGGAHPKAVAVDSFNHQAFIITESPNELVKVNTQNDTLVSSVFLNFRPGQGISYIPLKDEIYISEDSSNLVAVYDANTLLLKSTIQLTGQPRVFAFNENANLVYATEDHGALPGIVDIIDPQNYQILDTITVGPAPWGIAYNANTNKIYVSSSANDPGVSVIDAATNVVIKSIYVDNYSNNTVAIDAILNRVYVVNLFDGAIFVIDGTTDTQLAKIQVRDPNYYSYPLGLVVDPYLHKGYSGTSNERSEIVTIDTSSNTFTQLLTLEPPVPPGLSAQTFYWLGIDIGLHKVYVPHYGLSYIGVIVEVDEIPPTITINSPLGTVSTNTVSINVSVTDNNSGVASYKYFFDGVEIPNTQTSLYLTYESAGDHTFMVTAVDNAGNSGSVSSSFVYSPTTNSLIDEVTQMYTDGAITKLGSSIYDKLIHAQTYIDAGDYVDARTTLNALINQVEAQIDIHITQKAGVLLIANINYLLSTFP